MEIGQQTVSEDFSIIPGAAGILYTYWAIGFTDPETYRAAEKAGRLGRPDHQPFAEIPAPAAAHLRTGTEALTTAALAWLAPQ